METSFFVQRVLIAIGAVFSQIQCFSRNIRPEMFVKNVKKLQNSQELNTGVEVSFFIKLQAEYQ